MRSGTKIPEVEDELPIKVLQDTTWDSILNNTSHTLQTVNQTPGIKPAIYERSPEKSTTEHTQLEELSAVESKHSIVTSPQRHNLSIGNWIISNELVDNFDKSSLEVETGSYLNSKDSVDKWCEFLLEWGSGN